MDATEHFDLQGLNELPMTELGRMAAADPQLRQRVREKAEELLGRVQQECEDPTLTSALLRDMAHQWFQGSATDLQWSTHASLRWGGLFADSRSPGGRLQPWLVHRLQTLSHVGAHGSVLPKPLARKLRRSSGHEKRDVRTPPQVWAAETAQALLDDLAAHPRQATEKLPLLHLSELAGQRTVENVNDALSRLFESPERGPFVLLHPNRYPDAELLSVRPPPPGATGASRSYLLVSSAHRPAALTEATVLGGEATPGLLSTSSSALDAESEGQDLPADPWTTPLSEEAWLPVLQQYQRQRQHLPSPPKEFRDVTSYTNLRTLLVRDAVARRAFLAAKWRGRPAGLLLLAQLLSDGKLRPEVVTDYEYLDSELSDLERGDPEHHPPDPPSWQLMCGRVVREGDYSQGYRYRLEASAPSG